MEKCALINIPDELINETTMILCVDVLDVSKFEKLAWFFSSKGEIGLKRSMPQNNYFMSDTCDNCYGNDYYLQMTEKIRLSTKDHSCLNPPIDHWKCTQKFIADNLNCSTPWESEWDLKPLYRLCETENDLNNYYELRHKLARGDLDKELALLDCLDPNCRQFTWYSKKITSFTLEYLERFYSKETLEKTRPQLYCFEALSEVSNCFNFPNLT